MNIVNMLGDKDVAGLVVTMRDVTVKRELARELEQRVFRDDLTKLANRSLFMDRLDQARLRSRRTGSGIAVMFIDLDDFKAVNDGLGHAAGDTLLCAVSGRLERVPPPERHDRAARRRRVRGAARRRRRRRRGDDGRAPAARGAAAPGRDRRALGDRAREHRHRDGGAGSRAHAT